MNKNIHAEILHVSEIESLIQQQNWSRQRYLNS